jgi:pimeloyl-ACP methyl ester carboxylesterase
MPGFTLESDHGLISINDTALKNSSPTLFLIHGNSSSSKTFRHIFESENINTRWRLVSFDLPGHGASSNTPDPEKSYWQGGYADLAVHILQHLNITSVVILGWSLGGHIGIELVSLIKSTPIELKGLMIVGTPPVLGKEQIAHGFKLPDNGSMLAGKKNWTNEETESFARNSVAAGKEECFEEWMLQDATRTDGRARMIMWNCFVGTDDHGPMGVDQRKVVEETDVLIAVINGAEEQFVDLDYLDRIKWKKLWRNECMRLKGLKHAPFWEDPKAFEPLLIAFLQDCEENV